MIMLFVVFRSVSFIFATGGMAFLLLTFCYLVIDVLGWWTGAPFSFPGKWFQQCLPGKRLFCHLEYNKGLVR